MSSPFIGRFIYSDNEEPEEETDKHESVADVIIEGVEYAAWLEENTNDSIKAIEIEEIEEDT